MATKVAPRRPAMGMATVGAIATLSTANKPRPPSSPRSSCADITNGMGGAEGKEVARLSAKILDLMSQLQARDAQRHHLEAALELARREAANAKALIASGAPAAAPAEERAAASAPGGSSSRARMPAPRPATGNSPARNVQLRILAAALREADQTAAQQQEELAAARAMVAHRSRGPSPGLSGADAPAPGIVARLQADLAEAAEERRSLRQQLQVRAALACLARCSCPCAARLRGLRACSSRGSRSPVRHALSPLPEARTLPPPPLPPPLTFFS